MCLPGTMIGVLSDNHHFHLVKRAEVESVEYQFSGGIDCGSLIFLSYKVSESYEIILFKFRS